MAYSTAARIADEARTLLLAEGLAAVSMRRVASAAGITAMAIYRHYPSREALLGAVADQARAEITERWRHRPRQATPRAELRSTLNAVLDLALGQPALYSLLTTDSPSDSADLNWDPRAGKSPVLDAVAAAIDEGMDDGDFPPDDVWQVAVTIVGMLHGLISLHHAGQLGLSDPEFRVLCGTSMTRLLDGVAPQPATEPAEPVAP